MAEGGKGQAADVRTLDAAHAAMSAAPGDDAARLRYYARLADGMLWLWTEEEASGGTVRPRVFRTEDGPLVLAYDSDDRLAEAAGAPVPYAALPGRVIVRALAGQTDGGHGVAMGINLGAEAPAFLVPAEALGWLSAMLDPAPVETVVRPRAFRAPDGLPPVLLELLDDKLSRAGVLTSGALLSGVLHADGRRGHLIAFLDAAPGAEAALTGAVAEALAFSGLESAALDVAFLSSGDAAAQAMARTALQIDLPASAPPAPASASPGSKGPPRLR